MENHNLPPGSGMALLLWLKINAPTIYGVGTSICLAALVTLKDGKAWRDCLYAGGICGVISLGVINSLELFGMSESNALIVGVIIGGMGVERCLAIIRMVASIVMIYQPLLSAMNSRKRVGKIQKVA